MNIEEVKNDIEKESMEKTKMTDIEKVDERIERDNTKSKVNCCESRSFDTKSSVPPDSINSLMLRCQNHPNMKKALTGWG